MALTLPPMVSAQDAIPIPSPNSKTVRLSDLEPEVVSKIKAEHYAAQDQNIHQAYYQQLKENQQRVATTQQTAYQQAFEQSGFSQPRPQDQFQRPVQGAFPRTEMSAPDAPVNSSAAAPSRAYAAPQTFMPPVHITPPRQRYTPGIAGHSLNGNYNAVQNFSPQAGRRSENTNAYRRPVPPVQQNEDLVQPQRAASRAPKEDTHVFLQDRISNALSRHFKRGERDTNTEPKVTSETQPVREEVVQSVIEHDSYEAPAVSMSAPIVDHEEEIVFNSHSPAPLRTVITDVQQAETNQFVDEQSYSEILASNQYASRYSSDLNESGNRPSDHEMAVKSSPRVSARQRTNMRADYLEQEDEAFDISVGEADQTIFDRYEQVRQTSAESTPNPIRRRVRPQRNRLAAAPRPIRRDVPADNVSILLQEDERGDFSPRKDLDESPFSDETPSRDRLDRDRLEIDRLNSERLDRDRSDRDRLDEDRPKLRDDLKDATDEDLDRERKIRDRVRSRLDDELDLEELDDPRPEDEDDEEDFDSRPNRVPRKTCREFQQELIAGSIRDISLDISPPAASEGAQYGGLARTWTDQRGNTLATGALVDLRRGYVILDSGQKLPYARLSEADLSAISEFWRLPEVCVIGNSGGSPYRSWTPQVVTWKASNLCHKPLYFENQQLERYGHSRGPVAQPLHSTLHFFVSLVSLPYQRAISPPNECQYALGYYRPGNCAPWLKDPIPISLQGIRRQTLFVTGAAFIP